MQQPLIFYLGQDIMLKFTNILNSFNHNDVTNHWIMHKYLVLSNILYRYIDKGLLELFGPIGGRNLLHFLGFSIELLSTGFIPHYALIMVLSLFIPLGIFSSVCIKTSFVNIATLEMRLIPDNEAKTIESKTWAVVNFVAFSIFASGTAVIFFSSISSFNRKEVVRSGAFIF